MDVLPGADLEVRIYVLLGIIGIMFFGAILALGLGRLISLKSSSNLMTLSDDSSPFSSKPEKEVRQKKQKTVKPKRSKKIEVVEEASFETVDDILAEPKPSKVSRAKEKEPKQSRFGKKKQDAIEMLASPSGYVEEYAPTDSRNMDADYVPSVVEYQDDEYSDLIENNSATVPVSEPAPFVYENPAYEEDYVEKTPAKEEDNWDGDFLTDSAQATEDEEKKKKNSSPFSKNDDWEF